MKRISCFVLIAALGATPTLSLANNASAKGTLGTRIANYIRPHKELLSSIIVAWTGYKMINNAYKQEESIVNNPDYVGNSNYEYNKKWLKDAQDNKKEYLEVYQELLDIEKAKVLSSFTSFRSTVGTNAMLPLMFNATGQLLEYTGNSPLATGASMLGVIVVTSGLKGNIDIKTGFNQGFKMAQVPAIGQLTNAAGKYLETQGMTSVGAKTAALLPQLVIQLGRSSGTDIGMTYNSLSTQLGISQQFKVAYGSSDILVEYLEQQGYTKDLAKILTGQIQMLLAGGLQHILSSHGILMLIPVAFAEAGMYTLGGLANEKIETQIEPYVGKKTLLSDLIMTGTNLGASVIMFVWLGDGNAFWQWVAGAQVVYGAFYATDTGAHVIGKVLDGVEWAGNYISTPSPTKVVKNEL